MKKDVYLQRAVQAVELAGEAASVKEINALFKITEAWLDLAELVDDQAKPRSRYVRVLKRSKFPAE